jgi:nicotinate-nucleotide pyrophosphorylase (carboxylating)
MSGVATKTRFFQQEIAHTNAFVLDTRKTIPAWRLLDKYSVKMGGGKNHRMGLFDMIMIKDNHIAAAGSITKAVEQCRDEAKRLSIAIEVETQTLDDVREALACGDVDRIMFDNFTPELMKEAVAIVNKQCETEASGNITLETIRSYAETGVDFISSGALTHSVTAFDISMKFHEE